MQLLQAHQEHKEAVHLGKVLQEAVKAVTTAVTTCAAAPTTFRPAPPPTSPPLRQCASVWPASRISDDMDPSENANIAFSAIEAVKEVYLVLNLYTHQLNLYNRLYNGADLKPSY